MFQKRFPTRRHPLAAGAGLGAVTLALAVAVAVAISAGGVAGAHAVNRTLIRASRALAAVSPTIPAKMPCSALATDPSFVTIPGNPTSIASATVVPAGSGNPEYCDVQGMIAPQTHFELKLPIDTWQGRYLQNGCGGYCGAVSSQTFPSCDATLGGDFALATDDEGHASEGGLGGAGLFSFNSQKLREEYGYQSEQSLYVVARAIITAFYGQPPDYSYYDGCSDGGREAMEMAERYPDDFNGIIAGAPEIIAGPLNAELQTWDYRVNTAPDGSAILTATQAAILHNAVISACQGDDGVPGDGIITDPRDCNFSPFSIVCEPGQTSNCLTEQQARTAEELYQGPVDPQGRHLYPGGLPLGSESSWPFFQIPVSPGPSTAALVYSGLSLPYLRFMLLPPGQLGPDPSQWQFTDQAFHSMFPAANVQDAMSTDLSAFRAHGGKLIIWQGWADQAIPTFGTVDYYETLAARNGGYAATQQFARMFLFPTVAHCGGGYANSSFDVLLPLVRWVEDGIAPSQIIATDTIGGQTVTRPVYPYPEVPMYNGSGPTDEASSFHPIVSPHADEYSPWIGNYLFYQPIGVGPGQQENARRGRA
ncbi:MAG TPA: tannase/feruloyl esterase family alpha/beta hydrolase [Solirubrobacteraceae bacterium]|nr:tannase/feruloyl esterase family alpha/beta hydrolase [Solirubrobacteraceae bacterium]